MSNIKTRYLQLSDVIMLEYSLLGEDDEYANVKPNSYIFTKLADKHYATFLPSSTEVNNSTTQNKITKKNINDVVSFNTINHLAIPQDNTNSFWYTFLDPDYEFCNLNNYTTLDTGDLKVSQYSKYCTHPTDPTIENPFSFNSISQEMRLDSIKLFFVNGYDFSNIYGILSRVSVLRNDGFYVDLCNFFFNKSNVSSMMKYLSKPIIFNNSIYDRYIEINVLCLYDILHSTADEQINDLLDIKQNANIKLQFSSVSKDDYTIKEINYSINDLKNGNIINNLVNCEFMRSSTLKGAIPTENINSDNLGLYIGENPDSPYIEFYGTWKNNPLTFNTVQNFNRTIKLYDTSLIKKDYNVYDIDENYQVETNLKKWVAIHEIECSFMHNNTLLKTETYNMSQIFVQVDNEITKFYYRPVIFDEALCTLVNCIKINYSMRFINVDDKVQFRKTASLSLENINKFYAKGSRIKVDDVTPYKIYNKIVENKQNISGNAQISPKTKYVKVFYDSTNIILEENNGSYYGSGSYTLSLSQVAKTYKFIIKKYIYGTKYEYFDLSNGYYKLYVKDANNIPIIIDPTYSNNMNTVLGEIEFHLSTATINKLMDVPESNRKMSIVAYNDDNSVSSLYDFSYTFN